MSIEDIKIGRLRVAVEDTRANFGISKAASPGDFVDMPFVEGTVQPQRNQDALAPNTTQGYLDSYERDVHGKKSTTLALTTHLSGTGEDLDGVNVPKSATNWWMARLLQTVMGGFHTPANKSPAAATEVVTATATSVTVTSTHGTRFSPGGAIACLIGGRYEAREILSVVGDVVNVKVAFSTAPSAESPVLGAYTFYLAEDPDDSLQFILEGAEQSDRFLFTGMQGGIGINVNTGELAQLTMSLTGANWEQLDAATFVPGTPANYNPVAIVDSEFIVATVGSTTRNVVDCQAQTYTPALTYVPITSPSGVQTLKGFRRTRARAITGSFQPYFDSSALPDYFASHESRSSLALFQQLGSSSEGGMALISVPTVQIAAPQRADNGGLSGLAVNWQARHDEALAGSNELQRSAFRIHLFR